MQKDPPDEVLGMALGYARPGLWTVVTLDEIGRKLAVTRYRDCVQAERVFEDLIKSDEPGFHFIISPI